MQPKPFLISTIHFLLASIVFLIPLFFTNQFVFAFTPAKTFLFYLLVEVVFSLWLFAALQNKKYFPPLSSVLIAGGVFLALYTLSGILSVSPEYAFWSSISRMSGLILLYHVAAFVLVLIATVRTKETWRMLFWASVISASVVAVLSYLYIYGIQIGLTVVRNDATIGNTSYIGTYLLFNFFFVLILYIETRTVKKRIILGGLALLILFCPIFFNFSNLHNIFTDPLSLLGQARAATTVLLIGSTLFGLAMLTRTKYIFTRYTGWIGVVAIVLGGILVTTLMLFPGTPPREFLIQEGAGTRVIMWNSAVEGIKERPLLGFGPENYFVPFYKYIDPVLWNQQYGSGAEVNIDKPHNTYLEIAVMGGLLGLIAYLIFLYTIFSSLFTKPIPFAEKALIVVLLFAYLLQNTLFFDTLTSYLMFGLIIGYIVSKEYDQQARIKVRNRYAFGVIPLFLVLFWFFVYAPCLQQIMLKDSLQYEAIQERAKTRDELLTLSLHGRTSSLIYIAQKMLSTYPLFFSEASLEETDILLKDIETTREDIIEYAGEKPEHYQLALLLAGLNLVQATSPGTDELLLQTKELEAHLFTLSPQNPQNYWVQAQRELLEGNAETALATLKESNELAPDIPATLEMITQTEKYLRGEGSTPFFLY